MSDRTYTWFAIPLSALTPERFLALAKITATAAHVLSALLAETPQPDPALGQDDLVTRLVDGVPCLVWEDIESDRGGWDDEEALQCAAIPYLHRHNAGAEYGPGLAAFDTVTHAAIRADADGYPIAGLNVTDTGIEVDPEDIADAAVYGRIRAAVLRGRPAAQP
ncbi:MAG: hypothetical protein J0M02_01265 [Planctomycetes bacterium]|nr:hypothetical protein [Planctomycetota bacterium]